MKNQIPMNSQLIPLKYHQKPTKTPSKHHQNPKNGESEMMEQTLESEMMEQNAALFLPALETMVCIFWWHVPLCHLKNIVLCNTTVKVMIFNASPKLLEFSGLPPIGIPKNAPKQLCSLVFGGCPFNEISSLPLCGYFPWQPPTNCKTHFGWIVDGYVDAI